MRSFNKQAINTQIPVELATSVENLTIELECSKSRVIKETLSAMLAERERRIQAGLDAGRVVSHSEMVDFASQLKKV